MQEIHSIGGGGGEGGGEGDRRLRPHHHQNHQALKCPRCNSLNTKVCYYNNYNLSQPRHFCKSCRRYWTKGGVLRNVPIGGGSRKSKRSKPKPSAPEPTLKPPQSQQQQDHHHNSNSHSSSESSSLTAAATKAVSASSSTNGEAPESINDSNLTSNRPSSKADFESGVTMEQQGGGECGIFLKIGSFSSLMSSMTMTTTNDAMSFGFGNEREKEFRESGGKRNYWVKFHLLL